MNTLIKNKGADGITSAEQCKAACEGHAKCFQWTFHGKKCRLVNAISHGMPRAKDKDTEEGPGDSYTSGWLTEKIDKWREAHVCDTIEWVRPSLERIY